MGKITNLSSKALTWTDIIQPNAKDLSFLKKKFKFEDQDIHDSLPSEHAQRPRVEIRNNYLFIVTLFPIYRKETRSIQAVEVDVFIDADHLFTIHNKHIDTLHQLYFNLEENKNLRDTYLGERPSFFFYEILDKMYHDLNPMMDHISRDLKEIEKKIFAGNEQEMTKEVLITKTNILNIKKIMHAHDGLIKKILKKDINYLGNDKSIRFYYNELLEHLGEIKSLLDTFTENINSLEKTNNTVLDIKTNQDIRKLTILTVFIFVIGIFTGIFGMNAKHTPIIGVQYDFWIILGIMFVALATLYRFFKGKKLL
jgi:magnesium/cobalt transport protein CorA